METHKKKEFPAMVQFKSFEKRLGKDPILSKRYAQTIQDDLNKDYAIKFKNRYNEGCTGNERYLPHHPVVNPSKPEKFCRVLVGAHWFIPLAESNQESNTLPSTSSWSLVRRRISFAFFVTGRSLKEH